MKKRSSLKVSKTNWRRLCSMKDQEIKVSPEHPELDQKHIRQVIVRIGLAPVPPKTSVSLRLDADVLEWFKSQEPDYQKRMNAVLRAYQEASL